MLCMVSIDLTSLKYHSDCWQSECIGIQ